MAKSAGPVRTPLGGEILATGGLIVAAAMCTVGSTERFASLASDQRLSHAVALLAALTAVILAALAVGRYGGLEDGLTAPARGALTAGWALYGLSWGAAVWLALDVVAGDVLATAVAVVPIALSVGVALRRG